MRNKPTIVRVPTFADSNRKTARKTPRKRECENGNDTFTIHILAFELLTTNFNVDFVCILNYSIYTYIVHVSRTKHNNIRKHYVVLWLKFNHREFAECNGR